ncbi:MAG: V-type ATPase subunit [Caldisericia bacterium]
MKLKYSDWCYLSSKSIILTNKFPKLEYYKSYLSISPKIFVEQIKKDNDISEDTTDFEEILRKDWGKTISFFEKKVPLDSIIEYFKIENNFSKMIDNLTYEKRSFLLKNKFQSEVKLFKYSPFLLDFIKKEIDFFNIESFLRHKYFETNFYFIPDSNLNINTFKNFEKDTLENFVEFVNLKYKNFIEKNLLEFLTYFEKKKDEYIIKLLKESKYFVFGPEIIFSYLKLKNYHHTNLNIIYNGLIYNQPSESIIRRLRLING